MTMVEHGTSAKLLKVLLDHTADIHCSLSSLPLFHFSYEYYALKNIVIFILFFILKLFDKKAYINALSNSRVNALHLAAKWGRLQLCAFFLMNGITVRFYPVLPVFIRKKLA